MAKKQSKSRGFGDPKVRAAALAARLRNKAIREAQAANEARVTTLPLNGGANGTIPGGGNASVIVSSLETAAALIDKGQSPILAGNLVKGAIELLRA